MRKRLYSFTTACILLSVLPGCHTHKKYAAAKSAKNPKFINDVYISGHAKNSATENAIARSKAAPGKKHAATPPAASSHTENNGRELGRTEVRKKYAEILGIKTKEIDNYPLYQFIDKWYGTNYRLGGHGKEGIDCSGFAQRLYGEVYGIDLLRTAMEQFSNCKRLKNTKDAEEGDLVFFHVRSKRITHVGVYLANDYFVHSSTSGGVIISHLAEDYWHKYFAGVGRVPKG
ncbi:MAG: NlpC/P60 family protein [Bacteroidota bacterium]